ncbi:PH domain-containing protein [Rothia uropygialis]|uniref:PH domain-containing protein n=1 Tax=Kocuria sp. 36 TaxID=1415402 RepID=UPI00101BB8F0|nr:PH domain-containing protein [Kocuria sp. 36]
MPGTSDAENHEVPSHDRSGPNRRIRADTQPLGGEPRDENPAADRTVAESATRDRDPSRRLGPGSLRFEEKLRELDAWDTEWIRPDRRYPRLILVSEALSTVVVTAILSIPLVFVSIGWWNWPWFWLAIVVPAVYLVVCIVRMALVPRRARARGYSEREDDLLIRHGVLWHKINAVPYGRLQTVEVSVGPLERKFGLAKVELHTASSSTDAKIEGISAQDAARLREELSKRGDDRLAGL